MKGMREHLQMYMKNKTAHLQVSNYWQREKNAIRCNTPHLCPEHPETREYTMYAI